MVAKVFGGPNYIYKSRLQKDYNLDYLFQDIDSKDIVETSNPVGSPDH